MDVNKPDSNIVIKKDNIAIVVPDGSVPITPACNERATMAIFGGMAKYKAYQTFISPKCSNAAGTKGASRLLEKPEVITRLTWLRSESRTHRTKENQLDDVGMRAILDTIARNGDPNEQMNAITRIRDWKAEDKRAQDAQSNLDPATIAAHFRRYATQPASPEHTRDVVTKLAGLLNVSLAVVIQACTDRDSAPPLSPSVDKSNTINTLQQVDSSNPVNS